MIKSLLVLMLSMYCAGSTFAQNRISEKLIPQWVGTSIDGTPCTGGRSTVGPFDYTNPTHRQKDAFYLIVSAHFNSRVENLQAGAKVDNKGRIVRDINYTLRNIPNHHRALNSMMRYQLEKRDDPNTLKAKKIPPAECYLQRAIAFSPKDAKSYLLYGIYLHRKGKFDQSLITYQKAEKLRPKDPEIHYNLGLLYLDLNQPSEALAHAKNAYKLGYPLPGLRKRLQDAGEWK